MNHFQLEIDNILRASVAQYVDNVLPETDCLLTTYSPGIPSTPRVREEILSYWYYPPEHVNAVSDQHLRNELLVNVEFLNLNVITLLPTPLIQAFIRLNVHSFTNEQALKRGVYGKCWTQADVARIKSTYVTGICTAIGQLAEKMRSSEMSEMFASITSSQRTPSWLEKISAIFPAETAFITESMCLSPLEAKNRDIIKRIKTLQQSSQIISSSD